MKVSFEIEEKMGEIEVVKSNCHLVSKGVLRAVQRYITEKVM
jgi:hypothetical protein